MAATQDVDRDGNGGTTLLWARRFSSMPMSSHVSAKYLWLSITLAGTLLFSFGYIAGRMSKDELPIRDKTSEGSLLALTSSPPVHVQNNQPTQARNIEMSDVRDVHDYATTISSNCQAPPDSAESISHLLENSEKKVRLLAASALPLNNEGIERLSDALLHDPEAEVRKIAIERLTESEAIEKEKITGVLKTSFQTETDPEIISNALDYYYHNAYENSFNMTSILLSRSDLSPEGLESVAKFLIDAEVVDSAGVGHYLTGSPSFNSLDASTRRTVLEDIMTLER